MTFPILIDPNHKVTEALAISNVPTVLWFDEDNRIVRPNSVAFGTDTFRDFSGVAAEPHMDEIRRWVVDGEVEMGPDEASVSVDDLSPEELEARLWFRIGAELRRRDLEEAARLRFEKARALAPLDFTVSRAAMPLTDVDPFGAEFFDLYERWQNAGMPYHGLAATAEPETPADPSP